MNVEVTMPTLKQLAQEAIRVQDACNLSGVAHGFSRAITALRFALKTEGQPCDTEAVNKHPICIMWVDKLSHLTGAQFAGAGYFAEAYDKVTKLSEG